MEKFRLAENNCYNDSFEEASMSKSPTKNYCLVHNKEKILLNQLYEECSKDFCAVWPTATVKRIDPIIEKCVRYLAKLEPLQYIKFSPDSIIASNKVTGNRIKAPVTKPNHPTAIGIHVIFDFQFKAIEFYEINSAIKGWGGLMVDAIMNNISADWQVILVFDYSNGFWKRMQANYNHVKWTWI